MKGKRIAIAAGAAALLAAAGAAVVVAQPAGLRGPLARADADRNGQVTLAELQTGAATMFAAIDVNRDGRADEAEMRAHHDRKREDGRRGGHGSGRGGGGHGAKAMGIDANGDGAVTLAEFQVKAQEHFGLMDGNRDGAVTAEEAEAAHRAHRGRR